MLGGHLWKRRGAEKKAQVPLPTTKSVTRFFLGEGGRSNKDSIFIDQKPTSVNLDLSLVLIYFSKCWLDISSSNWKHCGTLKSPIILIELFCHAHALSFIQVNKLIKATTMVYRISSFSPTFFSWIYFSFSIAQFS